MGSFRVAPVPFLANRMHLSAHVLVEISSRHAPACGTRSSLLTIVSSSPRPPGLSLPCVRRL